MNLFKIAFLVLISGNMIACSNGTMDSIPPKPKSIQDVKNMLAGKKFETKQTGFYGRLTVNDKTEMEWIDAEKEKEKYAKDAAVEQKKFKLDFLTDSTVAVFKKDTSYSAKYKIDDVADEYDEVKEGIKLRLTYVDPEFKFGTSEHPEITFTYIVLGAADEKLLLQLPQTVNRRPLISLLTAK